MADFSLEHLAEQAGQDSGNFAVKVANKAADFACGLYKDFPGALIPNPLATFQKGLWDSLCKDRPPGLPGPPAPPFTGGQCPIAYFTFATITRYSPQEGIKVRTSEVRSGYCYGPILNVFKIVENGIHIVGVRCHGYGEPASVPADYYFYDAGEGATCTLDSVRIVKAIASDIDNCGSLPATYPTTPIPPERLTGNTTIIHNDGTSITIPLAYAPVSLSAPVTINAGGQNFKFDFGGVTIGGGDAPPIDLTPVLLKLDKLDNDVDVIKGDVDTVKGDIDNVRKDTVKIKKSVDKPPPVPGSTDYHEDVKPPRTPPEGSGIEALSYVQLELTSIPQNNKNQSGNGSQTVYYAGWFEFRTGLYAYPREPIHFRLNLFEAPTGSDGYAYCLYFGYEGQVTVFRHKNDEIPPSGE